MAIFRVFCNFYVEAKDIDKAEELVLEECEIDFYDSHIQVQPGRCKKDDIWKSYEEEDEDADEDEDD